jgi:cystathionine beta-lyase/cystathionine gamma-synthase
MKKETRVNHPPAVELAPDNRPLVQPIYQSVKFEFDSLDETLRAFRHEREGFAYSRDSNPTNRQLELLLAEIQGRDDALVTGSGVAAVSQALLALTKQGDHVLCFVQTYGPSRYLIRRLLGRFGVTHTMLSIDDVAGIERELAVRPTRLVFFETPTNPLTRIADLESITRLARRHGALTLLDNTFAGFHQHGEYDVDLFIHSLTKYASGAGDVMGGVAIGRAELIDAMRQDFKTIGAILDPHAAFLVMRCM